jgi:hypothetical protein
MSKNPPTPLSPREQAALDRLEQWVDGPDDANPRETVLEYLTDRKFEHDEANRLLDQLLLKGYCYECDGIHVTDP